MTCFSGKANSDTNNPQQVGKPKKQNDWIQKLSGTPDYGFLLFSP
jgi:hypothetical protein